MAHVHSVEIVSSYDGREEILRHILARRCHVPELGEAHRIVHALFEQLHLGLAHSHLTVHLEEALSAVIESLEADGLKGQVLRVATQHVKSFLLALLRVSNVQAVSIARVLVSNDFLAALIKVNVGEDETL